MHKRDAFVRKYEAEMGTMMDQPWPALIGKFGYPTME
jgi:hypothetical protein